MCKKLVAEGIHGGDAADKHQTTRSDINFSFVEGRRKEREKKKRERVSDQFF